VYLKEDKRLASFRSVKSTLTHKPHSGLSTNQDNASKGRADQSRHKTSFLCPFPSCTFSIRFDKDTAIVRGGGGGNNVAYGVEIDYKMNVSPMFLWGSKFFGVGFGWRSGFLGLKNVDLVCKLFIYKGGLLSEKEGGTI